jgi:hypothetical protein
MTFPDHPNAWMNRSTFPTIWIMLQAMETLWDRKYTPEQIGITYKRLPLPALDPLHFKKTSIELE